MTASASEESAEFSRRFGKRAALLLSLSLATLVAHAFIPLDEFIHRGDDAYYYFKVAVNFPKYGFWTFDGINPTNGVQPLWALILTATAQLLAWCGISDLNFTARLFVFETVLCHFVSCMLLFRLLSRHVSLAVAIGAAGGLLFPLGIVWTRVWGMENSLYCMFLLATALFYQERFREEGTVKRAAVLGLLLGLTALSRLNAGLLIPILLAFYLASGRHDSLVRRLQLSVVIGAVASFLILPYFGFNYFTTGHLLPVSGGAKVIRTQQFLEENGITGKFTAEYWDLLMETLRQPTRWFVSSRAMDGSWLAGGRLWDQSAVGYNVLLTTLALFLFAPMLALRPLDWLRTLGAVIRKFSPFTYLLVFALVNAAVSVSLYPFEITYSIRRWWLAESEIVLTTMMATVVATSLCYLGSRLIPKRAWLAVATVGLALIVGLSSKATIDYYWDGEAQYPDWNWSLNDQRYLGALWSNKHLSEDDIIGSWNAGVIGYYSKAHVVNLDGLINNWEFLDFLERKRLGLYIHKSQIGYLMDTEYELLFRGGLNLRERLGLYEMDRRSMKNGSGVAYRDSFFVVYRVPKVQSFSD